MGNSSSLEIQAEMELPNFFMEPTELKPGEQENFIGELSTDGLPDGSGTLIYSSKDERRRKRYDGQWVNGKRTGIGTLWWQNGAVYRGHWNADQLSGIGTFMFPNKLFYEGEFSGNRFNGLGVLTWCNSKKRYEGGWQQNKQHGYGCLTFSDTDSRQRTYYKGEWEDGKRHGYGVMLWNNGSRYEGEWKKGKREGKGTHTFSNGDIWLNHVGIWKNGKRHGEGVVYYKNGDCCEGVWNADQLHGKCRYIYAHGRVEFKYYEYGKLEENKTTSETPSLEILCIEAVARQKKLVTKNADVIPEDLLNRVRQYQKNELKHPLKRAIRALGSRWSTT